MRRVRAVWKMSAVSASVRWRSMRTRSSWKEMCLTYTGWSAR